MYVTLLRTLHGVVGPFVAEFTRAKPIPCVLAGHGQRQRDERARRLSTFRKRKQREAATTESKSVKRPEPREQVRTLTR
jgi:hypothetical protein